jgi:hypothetical protein
VLPKIQPAPESELAGLLSHAYGTPDQQVDMARETARYGAGDTPPGMRPLSGSERMSVTPGMAWADMQPALELARYRSLIDQAETGQVRNEAERAAAERSIADPYEGQRLKAEYEARVAEREQAARGDADVRSRTAGAMAEGESRMRTQAQTQSEAQLHVMDAQEALAAIPANLPTDERARREAAIKEVRRASLNALGLKDPDEL